MRGLGKTEIQSRGGSPKGSEGKQSNDQTRRKVKTTRQSTTQSKTSTGPDAVRKKREGRQKKKQRDGALDPRIKKRQMLSPQPEPLKEKGPTQKWDKKNRRQNRHNVE